MLTCYAYSLIATKYNIRSDFRCLHLSKMSTVLADLEDDPWDNDGYGDDDVGEDLDWHQLPTHVLRSLAAVGFLIQAAAEAKFLGLELFSENMVTI